MLRTHCTMCGDVGRDGLSLQFGEPMRWGKNTRQNLWPCSIGGCTHLLCSACGTNFDSCQEHARYYNCLQWQPSWENRVWPGVPSQVATVVHPIAAVLTAGDINPPQVDAPPIVIAAAEGIPLADLLGDIIIPDPIPSSIAPGANPPPGLRFPLDAAGIPIKNPGPLKQQPEPCKPPPQPVPGLAKTHRSF